MASSWQTKLPPLTEADVLTALRDCFDPEVKLNLVDLGLIYAVALEADPDAAPAFPRQQVRVTMSLTTKHCPASRSARWTWSWFGSQNGRPTASVRQAVNSLGFRRVQRG